MLVAAALALTMATTAPAAAPARELAPRAELRDQHGIPRGLRDEIGHPTLVFVVDARRLRELKAWEAELRQRLPGLHYLRVADVPFQPPTTWARVAAKLRGRVPNEVPVLIDVERLWARAFALETREVQALLFDASGALVEHVAGPRRASLERLAAVAAPLCARQARRP